MGLCNQKDVFYEHLTVKEHLSIVAAIKRMSASEIA